jgi:hypothetical protein
MERTLGPTGNISPAQLGRASPPCLNKGGQRRASRFGIGRHGVENANNRLPGLSLDVVELYCNLDVCCYIRNPQQVSESERDRIMEWVSKGRDERCNVPYVGSLEG